MSFRLLALLAVALCFNASAQWYNVTFRGVSYAQDSAGNIVPTPLTERSIIQAAADYRGMTTNDMAMIYHVEGGGDSIKIVNRNTGEQYLTFFLFTFGTSLGRSGVSNTAGTDYKGVEYVYTQSTTRFSTWNDHSMGSVVLNKRTFTDGNGTVRHSIEGQHMQWCVLAVTEANRSAQTCTASFSTGTPFVVGAP